ncbi:MAG: hypothetical protein ABSB79_13545 [Syntrophales bacterium]|jgi:hypothetical protein
MKIRTLFQWFYLRFVHTSVIFFLIAAAVIFSDLSFRWMNQLGPDSLKDAGQEVAGAGLIFAGIALAYYIFRTLLVFIRNNNAVAYPWLNHGIKGGVPLLRSIHPTIGILALAVLMLHGYIESYKLNDLALNIATISGIITLTILFCIGLLGFLLYRDPKSMFIRSIHRLAAFVLVCSFAVHRAIVFLAAS